jgi:hypothetical protein
MGVLPNLHTYHVVILHLEQLVLDVYKTKYKKINNNVGVITMNR